MPMFKTEERLSISKLSNLYSCIRLLGNQDCSHTQDDHHFLDKTRLARKMENSQRWWLKGKKSNDFQIRNIWQHGLQKFRITEITEM